MTSENKPVFQVKGCASSYLSNWLINNEPDARLTQAKAKAAMCINRWSGWHFLWMNIFIATPPKVYFAETAVQTLLWGSSDTDRMRWAPLSLPVCCLALKFTHSTICVYTLTTVIQYWEFLTWKCVFPLKFSLRRILCADPFQGIKISWRRGKFTTWATLLGNDRWVHTVHI